MDKPDKPDSEKTFAERLIEVLGEKPLAAVTFTARDGNVVIDRIRYTPEQPEQQPTEAPAE